VHLIEDEQLTAKEVDEIRRAIRASKDSGGSKAK